MNNIEIYTEKISKQKSKIELTKFESFTLYFFIFSVFGWILETLFSFYYLGHFTKRGFLYGPLCPIYGFGGLMLIIFFNKYKNNNFKLFTYAAIVFSIFEYIVSYGLEALFSMHWWDYTNEFLNLNGRISIFYSFAWGIIAILFVNHIYPFLKEKIDLLLSKISYNVQSKSIHVLILIYMVDTVASFVRYLS